MLTPYLVTTTFFYAVMAALAWLGISATPTSWHEYFRVITHPHATAFFPTGPYWFMPTILLVMLIARGAMDITRREWVLAILMAISLIFCLRINVDGTPMAFLNYIGVAAYFVWWGAGYFFCKYQAQIHRTLRLESGWVCLGLLAALIVSAVAWPQVQFPKAVLGILLVISLSFNYTKRGFRLFNHLYGHSFTIYLLHWFVLIALRKVGGTLPTLILTPIAIACGIYIPVLAAMFVKRFMPRASLLKLLVGVR